MSAAQVQPQPFSQRTTATERDTLCQSSDCGRSSVRSPDGSTIPIPDFSMLSIGVPELVIASKANDHVMASSPPTHQISPRPNDDMQDRRNPRRPSHEEAAFDVFDLGSMMVGQGVTPIEEFTGHCHEEEPVPGIDVKRHGSGISRPSDEDKRRLVEVWTVNGAISTSPITSRSVLARRSQESSAVETKRKTVDFDFASSPARPMDRYSTTRKESNTSSYTSSTRSGETLESPMIYSPPAGSPPLDLKDYATGTILDLVSDPREIREYRQLERKKDLERKASSASATSSSGTSASRSGSFNLGRTTRAGVESANDDSGPLSSSPSYRKQSLDAYASPSSSSSWRRHHHPYIDAHHDPHGRRTTLADLSLPSNLAHSDAYLDIGIRTHLPPPGTPYSPTAKVQSSNRSTVAAPSASGTARNDGHTDPSDYDLSSFSWRSPISPASPLAAQNISTNKPLFHPDLHPVADHHATNEGHPTMSSPWSSSSLPEHALYSYSTDVGNNDRTLTTLMEPSTGDDTSPSSCGTVRPSLVQDNGKLKAQTVADYRSIREE